ncbi:MAG: hypothetical protein SH868_11255 [Bythopirellula sp.]|nr:hypothetical protein [Bythopirellula sp.]
MMDITNLSARCIGMRRLSAVFLVTTLFCHLSQSADAAMLTLNMAGVDVRFKGTSTNIVDDGGDAFNGVAGTNPAIADGADVATLKSGDTTFGSWMLPPDVISFDLLVEDGLASLAPNVLTPVPVTTGTNQIAIFIGDGTSLRFEIDSLSVQRTVLGVPGLSEIFVMTGSATVLSQSTPGNKFFSQSVGFAYVATDAMFINNNQDGLAVNGVLTITGELAIPEPTTVSLGGLALIALTGLRKRIGC